MRTLMLGSFFIGWLLLPIVVLVAALVWRYRKPDADPAMANKAGLAGLITMVAVASAFYHSLWTQQVDQSAALFIGVPTLLAIAAVFTPSPRSALGSAVKAVTIGMLLSVILLWEGVLCVLLSAPLFYLVAIIIGFIVDRARDHRGSRNTTIAPMLILLSLAPMSLEGTTPATTVNRHAIVSETRDIAATAADVERAIFSQPRFTRPLPSLLRRGFPTPINTRVGTASPGSQWTITFRGGETHLNGQEPADGDLVLELNRVGEGLASWQVVSDSSHVTHFLRWEATRVEWQSIDATHTRVTWTTEYRRGLDPAWYFGPMERYAMQLATGYLIDTVATP